jgi:ATP-binding cassette subfamily C protein
LFILVVAADFFAPFRRYAEQYHCKAEGEATAKELEWYFFTSNTASTGGDAAMAAAAVAARAFDPATLPQKGLIVVSGPSGAGKSTLLRMLTGVEGATNAATTLPQVKTAGCTWISGDTYVPAGTLADAIAWNRDGANHSRIRGAAESVGLLDEEFLPAALLQRLPKAEPTFLAVNAYALPLPVL